jgi:outer membrane protein assembly factor BamD
VLLFSCFSRNAFKIGVGLRVGLFILVTALIMISCSGRQPESGWTAEEYFKYAKEKFDDENYFDAINDFTVVILRFPGSSVSDSAQYFLATCHYYLDEYIISAAEYSRLINSMSESPLVADAQFMLADSYYQLSPRAALDQEYTVKAIREFQIFLEDFPTHEKQEEAERKLYELREKLALKMYDTAELYRSMREFKSSIIYYDIVLDKYYDSSYADDAQYGKASAFIDMNDYTQAKTELLVFKDKFPQSELRADVDKLLEQVIAASSD